MRLGRLPSWAVKPSGSKSLAGTQIAAPLYTLVQTMLDKLIRSPIAREGRVELILLMSSHRPSAPRRL